MQIAWAVFDKGEVQVTSEKNWYHLQGRRKRNQKSKNREEATASYSEMAEGQTEDTELKLPVMIQLW